MLLRGLSLLQKEEIDQAKIILKNISTEEEDVFEEAKYILEAIEDPSKIKKANELAVSGSPYLFRSKNQHMIILTLPKKGADITYIKTLISDFHINNIGNGNLEINALLLGLDQHLIIIKSFDGVKQSMQHYQLLIEERSVIGVIEKLEYNIMSISQENFAEFYKNKDIKGYYKFFEKNYLGIN